MNILRVREILREKRKQKKGWALFIDLKSAFDKINHEYLFEEMLMHGIDSNLVETIKWMYQETEFQVGDHGVKIGSGVIQGGVLSPLLFNIAFNSLLKKLKDNGMEIAAYADDLVIMENGTKNLKRAINIVEMWAEEVKM